jgi:rhodanese-related sulfurtransferase/DNA-binding transcriptional ArsR family regulator
MSDFDIAVSRRALYDGFARVAGALANGRRLEILEILRQGDRSVDQIAAEIGQSVANTSQHLRVLTQAELVIPNRRGPFVFYELASDDVEALYEHLRAFGARNSANLDRLIKSHLRMREEGSELISRGELRSLMRSQPDAVLVVDVRPRQEYERGHLPGALSVPLANLEEWVDHLKAPAHIIVYCRGPYCLFADQAVRLLRRFGITARRLEEGFPEWRRAGLNVVIDGDPDPNSAAGPVVGTK